MDCRSELKEARAKEKESMGSYCMRFKFGDADTHRRVLEVVGRVAAASLSEPEQIKVDCCCLSAVTHCETH